MLDWGEEGHRAEAEVASLRAAFTQEVAVWHKLDHPNVTKVTLFNFASFKDLYALNKYLELFIFRVIVVLACLTFMMKNMGDI